MSAELKAEDRDWNLERVERFLQERNTETEGEGLSEFDDETYQMARDLKKRKKSRILPILTAIGALTVFGGVVWYAYNWNQGQISPDALPVVVAEAGPIKEQPLTGALQQPPTHQWSSAGPPMGDSLSSLCWSGALEVGGGISAGSRGLAPAMISSIWALLIVSNSTSACAIMCSLSSFSRSSRVAVL